MSTNPKQNKINKKKQNKLKRTIQETTIVPQEEKIEQNQPMETEPIENKNEKQIENKIQITKQMYPIDKEFEETFKQELSTLKITQFTQLQQTLFSHISTTENIYIQSPHQQGMKYLLLFKLFQMIKTFPELKEEDLVDETKGGPYAIIICGDKNEVESMQCLIRNVVEINVTAWKGITGKQKETKTTLRKDPIIITTMSSLLNQLVNNSEFKCHNVQFIASISMEQYRNDEMIENFRKIFNRLPNCQKVLHSHENVEKINENMENYMTNGMKFVFEEKESMKQEVGYALYEMKDRNNLFATFVTQFASTKKLVLLFSTPAEVIFYEDILSQLELGKCVLLHALMSIEDQTNAIKSFKEMKTGILLTTQERHIPNVDMVVHFDIPKDLTNVHYESVEQLIIMIQKHEVEFVEELKSKRITKEYHFPANRLKRIQDKVEKIVSKQYYVHLEAREGYQRFIQSYHRLDHNLFSVKKLNLIEVAKSFGLENPTKVNLDVNGPENVSETPYEYKRKTFIGKDAYIPSVGKRNKIMKRVEGKK